MATLPTYLDRHLDAALRRGCSLGELNTALAHCAPTLWVACFATEQPRQLPARARVEARAFDRLLSRHLEDGRPVWWKGQWVFEAHTVTAEGSEVRGAAPAARIPAADTVPGHHP